MRRDEGAFLPASFWLAECHAGAERHERVRANHVGLLGEIVDPATGEPLGNTPLALSHVGLINAADTLDRGAPQR